MATPNLLDQLRVGGYNNLYKAFGGVVPGSTEAKELELKKLELERQIKEARSTPNKQAELNDIIQQARAYQQLNLEGQDAANALALKFSGVPNLLELAKEKSAIRRGELSAEAENEINKLNAANEQRLKLLAPVQKLEGDLRIADTGDLEKVLSFYSAAQDKNLAAQAAARKPGFGSIASLLGGLGLAAASLFG
jgi:hypothetical protein